jgi:prepilin-type N-terminal cleavage/methylation domain-containing protein
MRQRERGFSLIELLIVVAIILIIAAIAIPNLLRAKISANEASAIGSLHDVVNAEIAYSTAYPQAGFALNILALGPGAGNQSCPPAGPGPANACIIDTVLSGAATGAAVKSGYGFEALGQNPVGGAFSAYTAGAVPVSYNMTGTRDFCTFEDDILRQLPPAVGNTGGAPAAAALAAGGGPAVCTVAPWAPI